MPFGRKQSSDGHWIDFNSIYQELIRPALREAGFEPFRADEETVSGDILTDMFQELLLADLVVADLSVDNANVFYELGVRHAMRKRGLIHIQSGRSYMPFDVFNVRTIPYHCDNNGKPDPGHVEKDKQAMARAARDTWTSDQDAVHSPIFNLLTGLTEPDRKSLRTHLATGFWREYNEWTERVKIAQRQKRIGDVLLLTEEIRNPLIQEEAIAEAGNALKSMGRSELALAQYQRGLDLNPTNVDFRREEAYHLNELRKSDEAIVKLERLIQDEPNDIEAMTYQAAIYRALWRSEWADAADAQERLEKAYGASHWLSKSIDSYMSAYRLDQNHTYSGVNALVLSALLDHLTRAVSEQDDPDAEAVRHHLPLLSGAVRFALDGTSTRSGSDYWALVSNALAAVIGADDPKDVERAAKKALTAARKNTHNLRSSLELLEILESLEFRPEHVQAGVAVLRGELARIRSEEQSGGEAGAPDLPREQQVFLFSGHMIDATGQEPRFPAAMENEAREKVRKALDEFGASSKDLAICAGAACGGDILFIEECLRRDMRCEVLLPVSEPEFVKDSIAFAGDEWVTRFYGLRDNPNVTIRLQPDHVGSTRNGDSPYERNNRWALYSTLIYGIERVRLIVLWDGKTTDAHGQAGQIVGHMVEQVRQFGGVVEHLNTTKFDYWKAGGKIGRALEKLAQGQ